MLWIKALHIIFMVTWFSGLFYLPRLFVYHSQSHDKISIARFKIMERNLYYGITTPGAILTIIFGILLFNDHQSFYLHLPWMHIKLGLVLLLVAYHIYLGKLLYHFKHDLNWHTHIFFRWLNEVPVIFLVGIVWAVVSKPLF